MKHDLEARGSFGVIGYPVLNLCVEGSVLMWIYFKQKLISAIQRNLEMDKLRNKQEFSFTEVNLKVVCEMRTGRGLHAFNNL